jgi:cytochrome c
MRTPIALTLSLCICATAAPAQEDEAQLAYNNHCRTCHSLNEGDSRLGPSLHGVLGRQAGTMEGYSFTGSLTRSGVTWDAETLDAFIENPDAVVPGHGMRPYAGISDHDVRAQIVAALGG